MSMHKVVDRPFTASVDSISKPMRSPSAARLAAATALAVRVPVAVRLRVLGLLLLAITTGASVI